MRTTRTIVLELTEQEAKWLKRALENYSFQEADENERSFKRDLWDGLERALAEKSPTDPPQNARTRE